MASTVDEITINFSEEDGTQVCKEVEKEIRTIKDFKTASPHIQASWTIFETCGVPHPDYPPDLDP